VKTSEIEFEKGSGNVYADLVFRIPHVGFDTRKVIYMEKSESLKDMPKRTDPVKRLIPLESILKPRPLAEIRKEIEAKGCARFRPAEPTDED